MSPAKRQRCVWTAIVAASLIGGLGCGSPSSIETSGATCAKRSSLLFGTKQSPYIGLPSSQEVAIGHLVDDDDFLVCSFTLVTTSVALTARHCLADGNLRAVFTDRKGTTWKSEILNPEVHPELDLAIFRLPQVPDVVAAIPIVSEPLELQKGTLVELAGRGLTELNSIGLIRFVVEEVVDFDSASVSVSGDGHSGACFGDSGGPMLVRTAAGHPAVGAVLSVGSRDCLGIDTYIPVEAGGEWLSSRVGDTPATDAECGSLSTVGRCFGSQSVWCDGSTIRTEECKTEAVTCSWSAAEEGYRCVSKEATSCEGLTEFGECRSNIAVRCAEGTVEARDCGPCGYCARNPSSGRVDCATL